jgi:hypothetical protein
LYYNRRSDLNLFVLELAGATNSSKTNISNNGDLKAGITATELVLQ